MEHDIKNLQIDMAELKTDIGYIKDTLNELKETLSCLDKKYVTKEAFSPIQRIVYGMVGAVLLAALYAVINLVIK